MHEKRRVSKKEREATEASRQGFRGQKSNPRSEGTALIVTQPAPKRAGNSACCQGNNRSTRGAISKQQTRTSGQVLVAEGLYLMPLVRGILTRGGHEGRCGVRRGGGILRGVRCRRGSATGDEKPPRGKEKR